MKLITKQLPNSHNLFFFGDQHKGATLSSGKGWNVFLNAINSPYDGCPSNYGADGGDCIEAITVDDKRSDARKMKEPLPRHQERLAKQDREPIKDILLYVLQGNHDFILWRFGDLVGEMCTDLGVDYGTYSVKLTITDKNGGLMYKVFDTHGRWTFNSAADDPLRREANMKLSLKRRLKNKFADCAVMITHHAHKLLVTEPTRELYLFDDGKKIKQNYTGYPQNAEYIHPDARWYGCAGSFLRLWEDGSSGYGERAGYDPTELGFLVLKVRNKKIVSLDPYYFGF